MNTRMKKITVNLTKNARNNLGHLNLTLPSVDPNRYPNNNPNANPTLTLIVTLTPNLPRL